MGECDDPSRAADSGTTTCLGIDFLYAMFAVATTQFAGAAAVEPWDEWRSLSKAGPIDDRLHRIIRPAPFKSSGAVNNIRVLEAYSRYSRSLDVLSNNAHELGMLCT